MRPPRRQRSVTPARSARKPIHLLPLFANDVGKLFAGRKSRPVEVTRWRTLPNHLRGYLLVRYGVRLRLRLRHAFRRRAGGHAIGRSARLLRRVLRGALGLKLLGV